MSDSELIDWVDGCLVRDGIRRIGALELSRDRTWSTVHRVETDAGPVWLKTVPPATAFEVPLGAVLADAVPDCVLTPLGVDDDRGWLLLPDAGPSLHVQREQHPLASTMPVALVKYARLQQTIADRIDQVIACGVVDMRPEVMPDRFDRAVELAERHLRAAGDDRTVAQLRGLRGLRPRYVEWCAELAAVGRPVSLDHNDLHADNVVGDVTDPRFYDWGDSVVAHPFASLLTPDDTLPAEVMPEVRRRYLEVFGDPAELSREADLACRVAVVARSLVWFRAVGDDPHHEHAHAPVAHLLRLPAE